jgi:hypothetical protein
LPLDALQPLLSGRIHEKGVALPGFAEPEYAGMRSQKINEATFAHALDVDA